MNPAKKILILAANPKTTPRLRLDEEVREIREGLKRAKRREQFEIHQNWAVRLLDLRRALLDVEPQIVHFTGHGKEDGLMVEDELGMAVPISTEALSGLFKLFANQVECVLLNACYSESQAKAISRHIDYVIGMREEIDDKAAIQFAVGFYDALGAGKPVDEAFYFGRNAIQLYNIPEHLIPLLLEKKREELPGGEKIEEPVDPGDKSGALLKKTQKELTPNPFTTSLAICEPEVVKSGTKEPKPGRKKKKASAKSLLTAPKINIGLIPILLALVSAMIAIQHIYNKQKSTLYLVIGSILFFASGFLWNKASGKKEKKMKTLIVLGVILSLLGFAACSLYIASPSLPAKNKLFHIFENRDLNGSIVVALWEGTKGKGTLIKNPKDQLKIEIFKKFDDGSIETVYKPEIDPSGVTVISELPEGGYCVGISFNGIILDYVDHVRIGNSRVEFIELINKSPAGTIKFEAVDQSNRPLSGIRFEIWSNRGLPFRGGITGKNGQTGDFWFYSLTDKSIGSYYAVAEIEDETGHRREVWRSKPFRPFFEYVGDKCEVMRAVINIKK